MSKFTLDQQEKIKKVISHDQIYQDVNESVYKMELKKWIGVMEGEQEFDILKKKCEKLFEIWLMGQLFSSIR